MNKFEQKRQYELQRQKARQQAEALLVEKRKKTVKACLISAIVLFAVVALVAGILILTQDRRSIATITVQYEDDEGVIHTGDIVVELDRKTAPITVKNFVKLADSGFYDGLTWHRVIEDFMIQGGDPLGTGTGGSDTNIKGEFSANGVENDISHVRGVISMARSNAGYDTASSQFFIVHKDYPSLDGKYAAFGHVLSGMEYVDGIATMQTDANDKPVNTAIIVKIVIS